MHNGLGDTPVYIHHQSSILLKHCLQATPSPDTHGHLILGNSYFHIILFQQHKLKYYNLFAYDNVDELLRYLMAVLHVLGHKKKPPHFFCWGDLHAKEARFLHLAQYLSHLTLGQPLEQLSCESLQISHAQTAYIDLLTTDLPTVPAAKTCTHEMNIKDTT